MTPRSRTGKLMQGLWGRFGKKTPEQPPIEPKTFRPKPTPTTFDLDESEFPSAQVFDVDDEETNWDDTETIADEQQPIVYSQPIVPSVAPSPSPQSPATRRSPAAARPAADLDDWDDALPAPTVRNSDRLQARRNPKVTHVSTDEDIWAEVVPTATAPTNEQIDERIEPANSNGSGGKLGLWSSMLRQLRRILPPPLRRLSDAILTALLVMLVTLGIWIVDGLFAPPQPSPTAAKPPAIAPDERSNPKEPKATPPLAQPAPSPVARNADKPEPKPEIDRSQSVPFGESTPQIAATPAPLAQPEPSATEPAQSPDLEPAAESESPAATAAAPASEPKEIEVAPTPPAPPIAPKVSPDREFIDAIATQIDALTSEYPDNIIAGLDVDVARSRAIVTLDDSWQTLSMDDFDRLLDRMWQQAKANHFNKLEIHNPQGTIIARSPVVGDRMIVVGG